MSLHKGACMNLKNCSNLSRFIFLFSMIFFLLSANNTYCSITNADENKATNAQHLKSPNIALLYSLSGTLIPVITGSSLYLADTAFGNQGKAGAITAVSGMIWGPYLGNIYSGVFPPGYFLGFILKSVLGIPTIIVYTHDNWNRNSVVPAGAIISMITLPIITVISILEIGMLPGQISNHNASITNTSLNINPMVLPNQKGGTYGLELSMNF